MTYPDLVPAISGFTEWFFIEVFVFIVLSGRRTWSQREIRSSIQEGFLRTTGGEILYPAVPGGYCTKTVYDSYTIGGQRV
jgi:hypothetical protein